jgi:hypothetical protein
VTSSPPATVGEKVRTTFGGMRHRTVHHSRVGSVELREALEVAAGRGREAVDSKLREQSSIEALDLVAAVERTGGVRGRRAPRRGEPLDDRLQVAGFLGPIVAHERVHPRSSHAWCERLPSSHLASFLGTEAAPPSGMFIKFLRLSQDPYILSRA